MPEQKPVFGEQLRPLFAWVGVVGSAITLFGNLQGVLEIADWMRWLVAHWTGWVHAFWTWIFSWVGLKIPRPMALLLTAYAFLSMLAAPKHVSVKQISYLGLSVSASRVFCFIVLIAPIVLSSNSWFWWAVAISPALFYYGLLLYRTGPFHSGVLFSWKPVLVAMTVLLFLALSWLSQLDLAPLLKAPKV